MLRETKFACGFLFFGWGAFFLIDKLFSATSALFAAAACTFLGIDFLISGHLHENARAGKIVIALAATAASITAGVYLFHSSIFG
jgi:hypothetical protein